MYQSTDKFSIAIVGSGRLLGMFVTECMTRFPKAVVYDRTDQFMGNANQEIMLGKTKFASPEFRRSALVAEKNLAAPARADVAITFQSLGQVENVTVANSAGKRTLSFNFAEADKWQQLDDFVQLLLKAVARVG